MKWAKELKQIATQINTYPDTGVFIFYYLKSITKINAV